MLRGLRKSAAVVLVLASAGGVIACGESSSKKKKARAPTENSATSSDTAGDPVAEPKSPRAAVLRLWDLVATGAVVNAVLLYDKPVRDAAGIPNIAGSLASLQQEVTAYQPVVLKVESTPVGSLVTLKWVSRARVGPSQTYSYLLRQRGGRWLIVYDGRLALVLPSYVTATTQLAIDPTAGPSQPSPKATAAGQLIAEKYRAAALRATSPSTRRALSPGTSTGGTR